MPRKVRSKANLLNDIDLEYRLLKDVIEDLDSAQMQEPGVCEEWSVKDLFAHLVEWKKMLLGWYQAGLAGQCPKTPAEDLKWNQLPILNERIYQKWKDEPMDLIMDEFENTCRQMIDLTNSFTEEQLLTQHLYPWMQNSTAPMYRWIEANTSSHYRWARLLIRKWKKTL